MSEHAALRFRSNLYYYAALVTSVYDGDTLTVDLDLGLGIWRHGLAIRLWKVNTPEVSGAERDQGLVVRDYVRGLLLDKTVLVRTILDKRGVDKTEKFGRLLGEILVADEAGGLINVNDLLLAQGMGRPVTAEGTTLPAPDASPRGVSEVACPYCGELRKLQGDQLAACPNCLDPARPLTSMG
jgi:micrococcal nuclease